MQLKESWIASELQKKERQGLVNWGGVPVWKKKDVFEWRDVHLFSTPLDSPPRIESDKLEQYKTYIWKKAWWYIKDCWLVIFDHLMKDFDVV